MFSDITGCDVHDVHMNLAERHCNATPWPSCKRRPSSSMDIGNVQALDLAVPAHSTAGCDAHVDVAGRDCIAASGLYINAGVRDISQLLQAKKTWASSRLQHIW
jgi:hypothetical protein